MVGGCIGNSLGYCCIDATPRDFGRFSLYLQEMMGWTATHTTIMDRLSTSLALNGEYGYYWWPINGHNGFVAMGLHGRLLQ